MKGRWHPSRISGIQKQMREREANKHLCVPEEKELTVGKHKKKIEAYFNKRRNK